MATSLFIFAIVAMPVLFFMLVWVVATVYRLYVPEETAPVEQDAVFLRQVATAAGRCVPVGAREIREDQRRYQRQHASELAYTYEGGRMTTFPSDWVADLERRRN